MRELSMCVRVCVCVSPTQVAFGSYHAITDMMASLSVRYPYMCYQFLAQLDLAALGESHTHTHTHTHTQTHMLTPCAFLP